MILLYHKVGPETPSIWWVSADTFDRQMADLRSRQVVTLDEYDPTDPRHVVITFDGVYENVWQYALPILRKWGYPFELFVIGDQVGGDNRFDTVEPFARFATVEQLEDMARHGARIQWHSRSHRQMDGLTDADLAAELDVPSELRTAFGSPHLRWFAYPHGDHSPKVVDAVRARFRGALSCNAGNDVDPHQLNRVTVFEDTRLGTSTVAVIVACYNYRSYVAEAIESVIGQTRTPDEVLVIDDASTDGSDEVIARYADRVRIVRNEHNLGIVDNFNKAVSLTRSDYVAFLGADNRMRADYVERCKAALDARPTVAVAYTDMAIFGPRAKVLADSVNAEPFGESLLERYPVFLWRFPEPKGEALARFGTVNFVHGSSMYRRAAFDAVGGYRASDGPEDHHLFKRMHDAGWGLTRIAHPLIEYRQHTPAQANTALGLQLENADLTRLNRSQRDSLHARDVELEARGAEIGRLDAHVLQLGGELEQARARALDLDVRIRTLENMLERRTQERDEQFVRASTMLHSTSWRLTSPLRLAGRIARGDLRGAAQIVRRPLGRIARRLPARLTRALLAAIERGLSLTGVSAHSSANRRAIADLVEERCAATRSAVVTYPPRAAEPDEWPRVDISVVTHNSARWIDGFAASVLALDYPLDRLAIRFVDNASTDDTVDRIGRVAPALRDTGAAVEVLRRPNLGYGAGHNAGIRAGAAPYCLVTNVDLTFEPDAMRRVVACAVADSESTAAWELRQKPYEHPKLYDPVTGSTTWNAHACVLLRRSAVESIGGYDETLFMYGEDVELSYRLRRAGRLLRYCPAATVWHFAYEGEGQVKPLQYTGSTFANLYLRLKFGNVIDMWAVPLMGARLLLADEPFPGSRKQVARSLGRLCRMAPRALAARRRSRAHFPFREWDYELVREGAFYEQRPMPTDRPLISVVTRTYAGRELYLRQALLSVAAQTWQPIEHVVVEDGGSTMRPIVDEVARATGATIRFVEAPKRGRSHAGNRGLAATTGRWCLFLDDDDLLFRDHLEVLYAALAAEPGAVASYSIALEALTDASGLRAGRYVEQTHQVPSSLRQEFDYEVLRHHNFMAIQSVLFERRLFETRGGFDEDMEALEDWTLWARYAWSNRFVYVPKVTSMFRTPVDPDVGARRRAVLHAAYDEALMRIDAGTAEIAVRHARTAPDSGAVPPTP